MMLPTGVENPFVPNISFLRELSSLVWWLDLFFLTNIFRLTFAITLGLSLWLFFSLFPNSLASFKKDGLCVVFLYLFICLYYVQYAPVAGWLWRGLAGKFLKVLMEHQIDHEPVMFPCGLLGYIRKSISSRSEELILIPLLSIAEAHLDYWVQFWVPQSRIDTNILKQIHWRLWGWLKAWLFSHQGEAERTGFV